MHTEAAIATWRQGLANSPRLTPDDLEELERHLRDDIRRLMHEGHGEADAVQMAMREMGDYASAEAAYEGIYWTKARRDRRLLDELTWRTSMLRAYLRTALRSLRHDASYTALNVVGLATGITICLFIFAFVRDEQHFDQFHEHKDDLYRLVLGLSGDGQPTNANVSFAQSPAIAETFAEVQAQARVLKLGTGGNGRVMAYGDKRFTEDQFFLADSTFFDLFSFSFIAGDREIALDAPHSLVLTEETAQRYFGDADALGQTVTIDTYNNGSFEDYTITGVLANLPSTSHLQFDVLGSFSTYQGRTTSWGLDPIHAYLQLHPGTDPAVLEAQFDPFLEQHIGPEPWYSMHLQKVVDIRTDPPLRADIIATGMGSTIRLFSGVALFILLLAAINFINLTTARANQRAKEVGVRKALGALRANLVQQFLLEAFLVSAMAVGLGVLLVQALLPAFNSVAGKALSASAVLPPWWIVAGLVLSMTVLAGGYPAFYLSRFQPTAVLKGQWFRGRGTAQRLRQGLVTFQFAISMGLVLGAGVVYQQMQHLRQQDLGFHHEQVVVLPLNGEVRAQYETFRQEILRAPGMLDVAASEQLPGRAGNGSRFYFEGAPEGVPAMRFFASHDVNRTYDIDIVAGRDFSDQRGPVTEPVFLVNEAFAEAQQWDVEAVAGMSMGMEWNNTAYRGTAAGVIEDFQLFSLRRGIRPAVMVLMPLDNLNYVSVRLQPEQVQASLDHLRETWTAFAPSYPFDAFFLDESFAAYYEADQRFGRVITLFALVALLIAGLGLYGLAAFATTRRTKEIGVRKVLGATIPNLIALLCRDTLKLVGIAFVVIVPLSYWLMEQWLSGFFYRIDIGGVLVVSAGLLVLLLAVGTVAYQAFKAARLDPVRSLRYE
ncbi:MAG: ABC transporter permease [Rhodothermales bacterium]